VGGPASEASCEFFSNYSISDSSLRARWPHYLILSAVVRRVRPRDISKIFKRTHRIRCIFTFSGFGYPQLHLVPIRENREETCESNRSGATRHRIG